MAGSYVEWSYESTKRLIMRRATRICRNASSSGMGNMKKASQN